MPRRLLCLLLLLCAPALQAASFSPEEKGIRELQVAMTRGEITAVGLVDWYLARIEALDGQGPTLNALAFVNPGARAEAAALDAERRSSGPRGALHGIPIVVKDNYETRGMPTTAGSATLAGFTPDNDAHLVARLRAAGAVILGKTNMHEFAYGITSVGSAFGVTRNPYDPTRHPGGSSGGTAAAVAANLAVVGMGSDTCGSIRNPSAHNALVGLRGTQGASSRTGIVPLSSTQDIGGPLARSVTDLALILDATVGFDPSDPQTAASIGRQPDSFVDALHPGALRGARIGIVRELLRVDPEDDEIARVYERAAREMEALGATLVPVTIPRLGHLVYAREDGFFVLSYDFGRDIDAYLAGHPDAPVKNLDEIIASGEVHEDVLWLLEGSAAKGPEDLGTYLDELNKRQRLRTTIEQVMAEYDLDALSYPTIRRKASKVGTEQLGSNCQLSANSGLPAVTVPAGFTADGMPAGIELLGRPWSDAELLGMAYDFEQATHHRRPPPLPGIDAGTEADTQAGTGTDAD